MLQLYLILIIVLQIQGKILSRLDLPVTAELWLRKATSLDGKGEEAATLFQKVRIKRLYESLSASYPVKIEFTKHGRAVVATKDVKPGDVTINIFILLNYYKCCIQSFFIFVDKFRCVIP